MKKEVLILLSNPMNFQCEEWDFIRNNEGMKKKVFSGHIDLRAPFCLFFHFSNTSYFSLIRGIEGGLILSICEVNIPFNRCIY